MTHDTWYKGEREGTGDWFSFGAGDLFQREIPFGWDLLGGNDVGGEGQGEQVGEESKSGDKVTASHTTVTL